MRTATVYAFCSVHGEPDEYLDPSCFCAKADYRPQERYARELIKLLSKLQSVRDNRQRKDYIAYYGRKYRLVPLWVASKCLTFGTMASFFDFQQQSVKTRACVALARSLGRDVVRQRDLQFAYRTLPEFRNICAHGERLYCARGGKNGDKGFPELLRALYTVVSQDCFSAYVKEIAGLMESACEEDPSLEHALTSGMRLTVEELAEWGGNGADRAIARRRIP